MKATVSLLAMTLALAACATTPALQCGLPQVASTAPVHVAAASLRPDPACNTTGRVSAFGAWLPAGASHF